MDENVSMKFQELSVRHQEIEEQSNIIEQQIYEIQDFSKTLDSLESEESKNILAPIGKGVFIDSEIKNKSLFVDAGAGIFIKKDINQTKKVVEDQLEKLYQMKLNISGQRESLNKEVENMIKSQKN